MRKNKIGVIKILLAAVFIVAGYPSLAMAQSSSPNYKVEESYFGAGGAQSSSPNYQARQSLGSLGAGSASSNNYDAVIGVNTPTEPFLEMYVTGANVDLGTLNESTPSYGASRGGDCNCSFSVRSYLSSEYVVVTASQPPVNESGHVMNSKTTQAAPSSSQSVEEFGMNLTDNSSPDLGANPVNQPDDSFADGYAYTGYQTPNLFKYSLGDIIARSPAVLGNPGIGKTDYTITYMAKISTVTPAGAYQMVHDLVAIATF